jgi:hypothetical protein
MTVLMRYQTDCEVAALATALNITWEEARKALDWRRLPKGLENPVFGNPWNLYKALIKLGFWKKNITLNDLLSGNAEAGKTIVLLHSPINPTLEQHWVTWHGVNKGFHLLAWGDSQEFKQVTESQLTDLFKKGFPNCAFQVYKASFFRLMIARAQSLFNLSEKKELIYGTFEQNS